MPRRNTWLTLAGAVTAAGVGFAAERAALNRKRRHDPEADEDFGTRRGERSRFVDLPDGARLFVEELGPESETRGVVFIHGSALRTDLWHYQMEGLGGHRLVFYDLRGHGLSQPKGEDLEIQRLVDDLEAVIDACGLEEVVLVGHSVGGMIALEYCRRDPEKLGSQVRGLGLLNTTYGPAAETVIGGATVARLERFTRRPLDAMGKRHQTIDTLRKIIRPSDALFWAVAVAAFGEEASAKQIDFTYDMVAETPTDVVFELVKSYRAFDMAEALEDVNVPALVVSGTHDRLTVSSASEYLAEHLPKADLHIFDGCGHMSMLERHDEVNELLTKLFNDTLGKPGNGRKRKKR
jgi:pimeloyl-ACP methyl ester carboxylesterase